MYIDIHINLVNFVYISQTSMYIICIISYIRYIYMESFKNNSQKGIKSISFKKRKKT